MTEEEEAAAPTCAFTSLKDHVAVVLGTEALMKDLRALKVVFKGLKEGMHSIVRNFHACLNDHCLFLNQVITVILGLV